MRIRIVLLRSLLPKNSNLLLLGLTNATLPSIASTQCVLTKICGVPPQKKDQ
jgi:hypothetical protein